MPNNMKDKYGRSKLHYVAMNTHPNQHREMTAKLIQEGNDPNLQDNEGWSPLHFAAQEWSEGVARSLIENGATVDIKDSNGNTPLLRAVFSSQGRGELIVGLDIGNQLGSARE